MTVKLPEYQQLFLSEAQEILNSLNTVLVELEKEPANQALLDELFRLSHTLKSMAQSMEYEDIAGLTHSIESLLGLIRDGKLKAGKRAVDLLFKSLDALGAQVEGIKGGSASAVDMVSLAEKFEEVTSAVKKERGSHNRNRRGQETPTSMPLAEDKTVRIPLVQLDRLMDITGELVLNRIRLAQIAQSVGNGVLEEAIAQMSRLTFQLQEQTMQIRLVPLEYIFAPYPRMVRDLATDEHKEVDLIIEGSGIGLDRSIQDEINEPLLHLLKNAVIHGIEVPAEREKLGKSRRGTIKLSARREKNYIFIEVTDDGRGIDIDEIKAIALKQNIIKKEDLAVLTDKEVLMLTTYPGYSRAQKVTEAAGRGVGLNASRIKIEAFGGLFDIDSKPNEGATFTAKLPLTMAIVQAMLVEVADETYCIPLSYISETLKVPRESVKTIEHRLVISHRDTVLPLIRLTEQLGFATPDTPLPDLPARSRMPAIPVVVIEIGSQQAGLVVDDILGQQEVVIKPLTGILKEIKGASGATILGTGKVALIIDVPSLF